MVGRRNELHYRISGDSRGFNQAVAQADTQIARFDRSVAGAAGGIERQFTRINAAVASFGAALGALGVGVAVRGIVRTTESVLSQAEALDRNSRALGVNVERYQELQFAFRQFGSDSDDLADALGTLADRAQDAIDGQQSFIDDFRLIGVEVDDLRGKRPAELFETVAESVASIEDPTRRTAGIVRIFGDDLGRRIAPLLNEGADGLRRYGDEAQRLNQVLGAETVESASKAANELRLFRDAASTAFNTGLVQNFAGELEFADEDLRNLAEAAELAGSAVSTAFQAAISTVNALGAAIKSLDEFLSPIGGLEGLQSIASGLPFIGPSIGLPDQGPITPDDLYDPFSPDAPGGSGRANRGPLRVEIPSPGVVDRRGGSGSGSGGGGGGSGGGVPSRPPIADVDLEPLRRMDALLEITAERTGGLREKFSEVDRTVDELGFTFASSFEDAILKAESFRDVLNGLLEDIARIAVRQGITRPIAGAITTGLGSLANGLFAQPLSASPGFDFNFTGGSVAFARGGVLSGFQGLSGLSGSVVDAPTFLPSTAMSRVHAFARGGALMGEAGPEAILPLRRGTDGKLGVEGGGSPTVVNVYNGSGERAETRRSRTADGGEQIDVLIGDAVEGQMRQGRFDGALADRYDVRPGLVSR